MGKLITRTSMVLLLGLAAILIQGTVLRGIAPSLVMPNLMVILVVYLAFYQQNLLGVFTAYLLGLEFDFCSGKLIGPWAGAFVATYAAIHALSFRMFIESGFSAFFTAGIASVVANSVYLLFALDSTQLSFGMFLEILIEALLTGALAPFVFVGLKWILVPMAERR